MDFFSKIFRGDRIIWMVFAVLCAISVVEVYSASSQLTYKTTTPYWAPILRHSMFLLGGLGVVLLFHAIPPKYFSALGILLPLAWVLMIATRFLGAEVNDSSRWLNIGGVTFQPSELAKICLLSFIAFLLSKQKEGNVNKTFWWIVICSAVTCGIILIDNGSTAILLLGIVYVLLWIGQVPWKKMALLTLCGIGLIALFVGILFVPNIDRILPRAETWKNRITDFRDKPDVYSPEFKITDDNFQESHAKIAVANGGLIPRGPGRSIERDYLPQPYSDFIYAIILEETGLWGGLLVMLLYIILFFRAGIIAHRTERQFPKLLVMGSALLITSQAFANMAVAVGLIPVTGQTLPLISRGGTSILITCIYFGIILSVSRYENPRGIRREGEIDAEIIEEQQLVEAELAGITPESYYPNEEATI